MENIVKKIAKYKGYLFCILIIALSIISVIFQNVDRNQDIQVNNKTLEKKDGKIVVYITGAVKSPGVYYLNENSRLSDALDICGGVLENADLDKLNLARKVIDSDKITVPVKQDEKIENDEILNTQSSSKKVNINKASESELQTLAGIGPSTAKKIIEYREKKSFNEIEDLMLVTGIGQSKFDKIKENICTD